MSGRAGAVTVALSLAAVRLHPAAFPSPHLSHIQASRISMACEYAIELYGPDASALPRLAEQAFDEVDRIDRLMSHYKAGSPLSQINRDAADHPVRVDSELFDFIAESMRYNRESWGAFDVTVGPLMKAWGFFGGDGRMPSDDELAAARRHVGASHVTLDPAERTIRFDSAGVELDLGGIAKGYAVDRVVDLLRRARIPAALVSAGGSTVYGLGAPPDRDAWEVAVQDPIDATRVASTVRLKDRALSIAGRSEKSFEAGGNVYSHIMDPRTGRPVQGVLSVAVLTASGTAGDALDDAFFVLGPERSRPLLNQFAGAEAFFFLPRTVHGGAARAWTMVHEIAEPQRTPPDFETLPFAPRRYVAYRASPPISIDGRLDDLAWAAAPWSEPFIDIEGDVRPRPRFATRARMLWDDDYFYVAAEMEEPDVWATLTERDSVIFRDNDFEVFIDPDGDTHAYYELEINALGTVWDLMLLKPYRDGGPAIHAWDIAGLRAAVNVRGTLNHPGDRDGGWTVELALPWKVLREAAPDHRAPKAGDRWRVNFSRVEWQVDAAAGGYVKRLAAGGKDPLREDNWVWSPQGAVNMHMPERWGYVQFSSAAAGRGTEAFVEDPNERVKWALRRLYYRQRRYRDEHGGYATTLDALDVSNIRVEGTGFRPVLHASGSRYEITASGFDRAVVHMTEDGRVWITR